VVVLIHFDAVSKGVSTRFISLQETSLRLSRLYLGRGVVVEKTDGSKGLVTKPKTKTYEVK